MPDVTTIPDLVKTAILKTKGFGRPDPSGLNATASMTGFGFSFIDLASLTVRLDQIAVSFKPGADINESDVDNCDTVQDCINLVQKAVS
jgi:hypothetical protein